MKKYSTLDNYLEMSERSRSVLQRVFFCCVLMIFVYNYSAHLFISQIGLNPILYQEIDPSYWLLMILHIPQFIVGNKVAAITFDLVLFISAMLSVIKPSQIWSVRVFYVFYFIYFMLFNLLVGHHYANVGILVLGFPFMFKYNSKFALVLACSRYYFLFILASAAFWKIWRGSLFHTDQLISILQGKNSMTVITSDHSLLSQFFFFIGTHQGLAIAIWILMGVIELSFLIGFFTYRFDAMLMTSYLLFVAGGFLIVGIFNMENLLMLITLFPVIKMISGVNKKFLKLQEERIKRV